MAFRVNEFLASLQRSEFAYQSHHDCVVIPPSVFGTPLDAQDITMRIEGNDVPGRGLQTLDLRYWGPPRRVAYQPTHTDVTLLVICSRDLRERDLFLAWQDLAVNRYRRPGGARADLRNRASRIRSIFGLQPPDSTTAVPSNRSLGVGEFDVGYYDDYVGEIIIRQYGLDGEVTRRTRLVEAYPVFVSPLANHWSSPLAHRLSATITYRYFVDETGS